MNIDNKAVLLIVLLAILLMLPTVHLKAPYRLMAAKSNAASDSPGAIRTAPNDNPEQLAEDTTDLEQTISDIDESFNPDTTQVGSDEEKPATPAANESSSRPVEDETANIPEQPAAEEANDPPKQSSTEGASKPPKQTSTEEASEPQKPPDTDETTGIPKQPTGDKSLTRATVIDSTSIVVNNFNEFNTALSGDNGYVNIYLGANIDIGLLGVVINTNKKKVMISGINPLDLSGPYTINERNSLDTINTIRVPLGSSTSEVLVRNVKIIGRNFYGTVYVPIGVSDVTITYENVDYNGPQISYNRGGILRIIGDSKIDIIGGNGPSVAEELAEVKGLELGGNSVINHYSPATSGAWLQGEEAYIKVLPDSNVTWNETGIYMIFHSPSIPFNLTLEEGASLEINTINSLFLVNETYIHRFGEILLKENSSLRLNQQSPAALTLPLLKVEGGITVLEGAELILISNNAPLLIYMTGTAGLDVQNPKTLVLYNKSGSLLEWSGTNQGIISTKSSFLNYWREAYDLEVLRTLESSPLYRWRRANGAALDVRVSASTSKTISVESNYDEKDYGNPPTKETLNIQSARVIIAGNLPLSLDAIMDTSTYISGATHKNADIKAVYTDITGTEHTVYGKADSGGAFVLKLPNEAPPLIGSIVYVYSSHEYKLVMESTEVIPTPDNLLIFAHIPDYMVFTETAINLKRKLIPREDSDWSIIIGDSRSQGARWELQARVAAPLYGKYNGTESVIDDAIVFIGVGGDKYILDATSTVRIAEGTKEQETETPVIWSSDTGIMLDVDTRHVYTGINYTARIEWILIDGP